MKKLGLATIALSALLLSGCGGGSKSDPMNDKKYVIIYTEVASGVCESSEFREYLGSVGFGNYITKETANNTSCQTYNKKNDGNECAMQYVGSGSQNCVIGFDTLNGRGKAVNQDKFDDISEVLSNGL